MLDDVRGYFRPEFVNRIDEIVVFEPLHREEIRQIVDIQLRGLPRTAGRAERSRSSSPTRRATGSATLGYDPAFGARPLKRLIQRELQDPLAMKLLSGEIRAGDNLQVDATEDGITIGAA